MYKPPENTNRVKSIKNKFESNLNNDMTNLKLGTSSKIRDDKKLCKSKTELNLEYPKNNLLCRQLSDPSKRNIKRTPAFRLDKKIDKNSFHKNTIQTQSKYKPCTFNKTNNNNNNNQQKKYCDKVVVEENLVACKSEMKSKFADIRSKFTNIDESNKIDGNNTQNQSNKINSTNLENPNLSFLYSEPIPKSLRKKNCDIKINDSSNENFYNTATLKISDVNRITEIGLTDTLKSALKKPLPTGPAPKKPPRTFTHSQKPTSLNLDKDFKKQLNTNLQKSIPHKTKLRSKGDPKYMLDKLESALKNNKIKLKKSVKLDATTTSGDESDDSILIKKKTRSTLPNIPTTKHSHSDSINTTQKLNFNCLNALGCTNSTYEKIKEPNSSFFVKCKKEEPVYAEPFHFQDSLDDEESKTEEKKNEQSTRNSLYYMSSPVLGISEKTTSKNDLNMDNSQAQYETSSLSSAYTSDLESAASTPVEENKKFKNNKISSLIQSFETKTSENMKISNGITSKTSASCNDELDTNLRVQKLKEQLQVSIDKSFNVSALSKLNSNSDNSESADENIEVRTIKDEMTDKFTTYVKSVRIYSECGLNANNRLFHCCLIVGLNNREPFIKAKFPKHVEIPHRIEELCFPDGLDGPMDQNYNAQCYSLVITNDKGERTFGYCRRVIPEGSKKCIPLAYCILSKHRLPRFYKRVLEELESRHGLPDRLRDKLINEFYYQTVPQPGESIKIDLSKITQNAIQCQVELQNNMSELDLKSYMYVKNRGEYGTINRSKTNAAIINTTMLKNKAKTLPSLRQDPDSLCEELILMLHQDIRYEETDLKVLHDTLPLDILQKIFASLLLERKIVLVSCVLSTLSSCIEALQSILYPFSWPHTLIPILPSSWWDYVEAPTPFICGVLSIEIVNNYKIDNALVVDLDSHSILLGVGDEHKILPSCLLKIWKDGISVAKSVPSTDSAHTLLLSDAYLRVFIQSCGQYKQFFINGEFNKEAFLKNVEGRGPLRFLKWFTETTMFNAFLDSVQNDPLSFRIFDKRTEIYLSESSSYILDKMKEWKKKPSKSFFRSE